MAYMSQEKKQKLAPAIKAVLEKYGVKGSLSVRNHSTIVLTIKSGSIDFIDDYNTVCAFRALGENRSEYKRESIDVNPYHYYNDFTGKALEFLKKLLPAMNEGNHDNSDIQTDYFDVGFYVEVSIGKWNKPYEVT